MVPYLVAFALLLALFWLRWGSKWGRPVNEASIAPRDRVAAHAIEIMKREPAGTLVLVAEARYLPHGGTDWIVVTLRAEGGGFIERRRAPERRPPIQVESSLSPELAQSIRAQLGARGAMQMRDQIDPVIDGTYATLSLAMGGHVQSAQLHGGSRAGPLTELLRFITDLARVDEG